MAKAALFVIVLLGTVWGAIMLAETLALELRTAVLLAVGGALGCLALFVLGPRLRRRLSHRQYRMQALLDHDLIVSKSWYRGNRVLHYVDGSVAALTRKGLRSFGSFDECRSFIDRR